MTAEPDLILIRCENCGAAQEFTVDPDSPYPAPCVVCWKLYARYYDGRYANIVVNRSVPRTVSLSGETESMV